MTFPILKYIKSRTTNIEANVTGILLQLIKRIYYTVVTRYEFYWQEGYLMIDLSEQVTYFSCHKNEKLIYFSLSYGQTKGHNKTSSFRKV